MEEMGSLLSMPVSFVTSAQKRGWNAINYRVSPNSVYLIQDEWRIKFTRGEEKKFWILERAVENGWIEMHTVFHPGSSRLEWVLVTFKKIMAHFERMKFSVNDGAREFSTEEENDGPVEKIDYTTKKVSELKEILASRGLKTDGKKDDLIGRLIQNNE